MGVDLEEIVESTAKTLIWPFKTVDNTLKFAHDAMAAGAEKIGLDRFSLAKYAAIGGTAALGALTATQLIFGNYFGTAILGGYTFILSALIPKASEMRNYFSMYKDTLYKPMELSLIFIRATRIVPLGVAIAFAATGKSQGILGDISTVLFTGGFTAVSSSMYFMDGDHSNWDKTKAKIKSAYNSLSNLIPKKTTQPQPNPGAAINYRVAA